MNATNYEEFDQEEYLRQMKNQIDKPNVLLCGSLESGKDILVNTMFVTNDTELLSPEEQAREVDGVTCYSAWYAAVNLYDFEGYAPGKKKKDYCKKLLKFIDRQRKKNPGRIEKHIHAIWYCVPAGKKDISEEDEAIVKAVLGKQNTIPITILLIGADPDREDLLHILTEHIAGRIPSAVCQPFFVEEAGEEAFGEVFVRMAELAECSAENLDQFLRQDIIPVANDEIRERRNEIIRANIPKYAAMAAASVVGSALIPVPLSDSVLLMAIQVRMAQAIIHAYGIEADIGKVITDIVGTSVISYIGKTFASQIVSVIPFAGKAATGAVNVSVAVTVTAVVGSAVAVTAEQYLAMCVKKGGAENISFTDYITSERFKAAMEYVRENKKEFNLDDITASIKKKYGKTGHGRNKNPVKAENNRNTENKKKVQKNKKENTMAEEKEFPCPIQKQDSEKT